MFFGTIPLIRSTPRNKTDPMPRFDGISGEGVCVGDESAQFAPDCVYRLSLASVLGRRKGMPPIWKEPWQQLICQPKWK